MRLRIVKREPLPGWARIVIPFAAVVATLILSAIPILIAGGELWKSYFYLFYGALGKRFNLLETFVKASPLLLTGLAVAFAFRAKFWNIGAEGQLVAGGIGHSLAPFHAGIQWSVLLHTAIGITLLPLAWYCARHWCDYRRYGWSHNVLLGYVGLLALAVCSLSGVVLTAQGLFGVRISGWLRQVHLYSTFATLGAILPHLIFSWLRARRENRAGAVAAYFAQTFGATVAGVAVTAGLTMAYSGVKYVNQFPEGYNYLYGTNRPFAPSLAKTDTGSAFDGRSLAGSKTCGTVGYHEQILEEWQPSAHRYAAMDPAVQGIQNVMAKQNGAESTSGRLLSKEGTAKSPPTARAASRAPVNPGLPSVW